MSLVKHVASLLTGSVESAVTALLLKKYGYSVLGIFVRNPFKSATQLQEELDHSHKVSQHLQIPLQEISFPRENWDIFLGFVSNDYKNGYLPAVDMLYNKHIIFGSLFEYVDKVIGVDALATEHYAQRSSPKDLSSQTGRQGVKLYKAVDQVHDQSMLLSQVRQKCLHRTLLPLGEFTADVVTKVAQSADLPIGDKHPVTYVDVSTLLAAVNKEVPKKKGNLVNLETGVVEDAHEGVQDYAIGDTVCIGNHTFYVVSKDIEKGDIKVVAGKDHPALYSDTLFTGLAHWLHSVPYNFYEKHTMNCDFRTRMPHPVTRCTLTVGAHNEWCGNDHIILSSSQPMKAVTPGHYAVFYKGEECIGSAKILRPGPSQYTMNFDRFGNDHGQKPTATKLSGFNFKSFFKKILNS